MAYADRPRFASVLGLGFGDCGKGLFIDFLCRQWQAHTVVRFNGSAQAGHNVVLPEGTHHTFSQFGSGSFIPGVYTVLAHPVLVHPTALLVENDYLRQAGVSDALDRLIIDARCRVITPFHQAAGRLRELKRGPLAHGTCGVGAGEATGHSLSHQDEAVRYGDLRDSKTTRMKLELIRRRFLSEFNDTPGHISPGENAELRLLRDETIADTWLNRVVPLLDQSPPATADAVEARIHMPGCILFEGAQGLLLDEWIGFHPHTTWSSTHANAVDALADGMSLPESVAHFGVLRTYLTRHGPGPFPTCDPKLNVLAEPHNSGEGWQGGFRRGHPDGILLRYALSNAGMLSGLLISHLDIFDKGHTLQWCSRYETPDSGKIDRLQSKSTPDLEHQTRLAELLGQVFPVYDNQPVDSAPVFLRKFLDATDLPVMFGAFGNTHQAVYPGGTRP